LLTIYDPLHNILYQSLNRLAQIFHELGSLDREDRFGTWKPQNLEREEYLNSTSQEASSKDTRKNLKYAG